MNKSRVSSILRISFSLFLLALLLGLSRENLIKIWQLLSSVNVAIFSLAFLLFLSTTPFMAWRLKIILDAQGSCFAIRDLLFLTLIGYFFTNFMPTSIGGDLVKGYYISQKIKSKVLSYTSIIVDRIVGMFSLALIAGIATVIMRSQIEYNFIFWVVSLLLLACSGFILLFFNERLLKKVNDCLGLLNFFQRLKLDSLVKNIYDTITLYKNHKKKLLKTFTLSLAAHFITFLTIYFLSMSLSVHIPFGKILLIMPVIVVLCMLPITMNGLGLREWSFVLFFRSIIGNVAALSLSLLYLAMFLLISLTGGIVYLFRR